MSVNINYIEELIDHIIFGAKPRGYVCTMDYAGKLNLSIL
jgi:hypothetical protein